MQRLNQENSQIHGLDEQEYAALSLIVFHSESIVPERVSCEDWKKLWQKYKYSEWGKWCTSFFYETSSKTTRSFYQKALMAKDDQQRAELIRGFLGVTRYDERQKFNTPVNELKNAGAEVAAITAGGATAVITIPLGIILAAGMSIDYSFKLYNSGRKSLISERDRAILDEFANPNCHIEDSLSLRIWTSAAIGVFPPLLAYQNVSAGLRAEDKPDYNVLGFYKFLWGEFEREYTSSETQLNQMCFSMDPNDKVVYRKIFGFFDKDTRKIASSVCKDFNDIHRELNFDPY